MCRMKANRLLTVAHVIHFWGFISDSFRIISQKSREPFDEEKVKKTLFHLVTEHDHAWVGITLDEHGDPLAFAVAQECTPEFETHRYFVIRWFYHNPDYFHATNLLQTLFEQWLHDLGGATYAVTTRRSAGEAIRCFSSAKYGFKKAFLTYEKDIK